MQADPTTAQHRPGCDALGGYGHGIGACTCGADSPTTGAAPTAGPGQRINGQGPDLWMECDQLRGYSPGLFGRGPWYSATTVRNILAAGAPQPQAESQAVFALRALVAAGFVTQAKVDEALTLPGAPHASAPAPAQWEPQFDVTSVKQEELLMQFCLEIAGRRGQKGSPPDPVRLLEMAQALYEAERDDMAPKPTGGPDGVHTCSPQAVPVSESVMKSVLWDAGYGPSERTPSERAHFIHGFRTAEEVHGITGKPGAPTSAGEEALLEFDRALRSAGASLPPPAHSHADKPGLDVALALLQGHIAALRTRLQEKT